MKYFSSIVIMLAASIFAIGLLIFVTSIPGTGHQPDQPTVQSVLEKNRWWISQIWTVYDGDLPYASATRRIFATRSDAPVQLIVTEYHLIDREAFIKAMEQIAHQQTVIGSRRGLIYPIAGDVPSSAFVIIGETEVVTVEYGLREFGNLMDWSQNPLPSELIPLVEQIPVR